MARDEGRGGVRHRDTARLFSPGYLQDPTHCNPCNETTWAYFDPEAYDGALYGFYQPKPWRIKALNWSPELNIEVILVKREAVPA